MKLLSESCDDIEAADCRLAKGYVIVNGYQYSQNTRGINVVLFDYHSGLFEYSKAFDTLDDDNIRTELTNFLNGLPSGKILFMVVKDALNLHSNMALALQRFGVSATFATVNIPNRRCTLAAVVYTGKERKEWEQTVNQVACVGPSSIEKKIFIFRELYGRNDCTQELGSQDGKILNSAFSAASVMSSDHLPQYARLHADSNGWCSASGSSIFEGLKIDLGRTKFVSGIAIQGNGKGAGHYVTQFKLKYKTDNGGWLVYVDSTTGRPHLFGGLMRDGITTTRVNWFQRLMARYIEIVPTGRVSTSSITCIRLELYGCEPATPVIVGYAFKTLQFVVRQHQSPSFSVYTSEQLQSTVTFGLSMAGSNESLASDIKQMHIRTMAAIIKTDYDKKIRNMVTKRIAADEMLMRTTAFLDVNLQNTGYYDFEIDGTCTVRITFHFISIDRQLSSYRKTAVP